MDRERDMERERVCVSTKAVKVICCLHARFLRSHACHIDWTSKWQAEKEGSMNSPSVRVWNKKGAREGRWHAPIPNYDSEQNSVKPSLESDSSHQTAYAASWVALVLGRLYFRGGRCVTDWIRMFKSRAQILRATRGCVAVFKTAARLKDWEVWLYYCKQGLIALNAFGTEMPRAGAVKFVSFFWRSH